MKRFLPAVLAFLVAAASAGAVAAISPSLVAFTPDNLHWVAGTGPAKGLSTATMFGDPAKSQPAVIRVKMPSGYTNAPHYHAQTEFITVLQGTLLFGTGDKVDKSTAKTYPAGSFVAVPAGVHHWSIAQGETIEQVSGQGPLNNIPVKH